MNIGSYDFPGDGATYMTAPSHDAYNFEKSDFTIEAWVNTFDGGPIMARYIDPGVTIDNGFYLRLARGKITLSSNAGWGYSYVETSNSSVCDGTWHHIAGVKQGQSLSIYLDGVLQPTTIGAATRIWDPSMISGTKGRLTLGYFDREQGSSFTGKLAEIRLWNVARTQGEIISFMGKRFKPAQLSTKLVGYWPGEFGLVVDFSLVRNTPPRKRVLWATQEVCLRS